MIQDVPLPGFEPPVADIAFQDPKQALCHAFTGYHVVQQDRIGIEAELSDRLSQECGLQQTLADAVVGASDSMTPREIKNIVGPNFEHLLNIGRARALKAKVASE